MTTSTNLLLLFFIIFILTVAVANKRKTVLCVINQSGCNKPGEAVASGSRG